MRKISKRLLSLICCITVMLTLTTVASAITTENCPGGCVHQAAIGTTHYDTLAEALDAATDGCTVSVLTDADIATALTVDKAVTLDLGKKALSSEQTALIVTDTVTIRNGRIDAKNGSAVQVAGGTVTIEKDVSLSGQGLAPTLELVASGEETSVIHFYGSATNASAPPTIRGTSSEKGSCQLYIYDKATITKKPNTAIEMNCAGKLVISGGTIQSQGKTIVLNIPEKKALDVSITGGKILTEDDEAIVVTKGTEATVSNDFVIGGTYNKLPEAFIPDYCRVTKNSDNTYTVIAEYTISYNANSGSGTMTATKADRGTIITLPANKFTAPAGKHFKAWNIGGKEYAPGATFAVNNSVSISAVWANHTGGKATCTSKAVCSTCGNSYGDYASHNLYFVNAYAATCDQDGMNSHNKCASCGQIFLSGIAMRPSSLTIPATGHQMQEVQGQEATCTEDGIATHEKCATCGQLQIDGNDIIEEDLVLPASGHTNETVPAVDSTCTQAGTLSHECCTVCGECSLNGKVVSAEELAMEMDSHILSDWQSDDTAHWKVCNTCGEMFRQHSHADADSNETCDDCGYAMPASTEMIPTTGEENVSFPFLIPMIVAVVIAVGGAVMVATKKKK